MKDAANRLVPSGKADGRSTLSGQEGAWSGG